MCGSGTSLLPSALLRQASEAVFSEPEIYNPALSYGPDPGYEPLRHSIASWLSTFYHGALRSPETSLIAPITADRITFTGGASQSLSCLLQVFTDPIYTRHAWMVAPTYYQACRIFEDAGFLGKMRAVPEDAQGIDIGFLKIALQRSEGAAIESGNLRPVSAGTLEQ